jgi:hypothetical protein
VPARSFHHLSCRIPVCIIPSTSQRTTAYSITS